MRVHPETRSTILGRAKSSHSYLQQMFLKAMEIKSTSTENKLSQTSSNSSRGNNND